MQNVYYFVRVLVTLNGKMICIGNNGDPKTIVPVIDAQPCQRVDKV
jgi:hypothetical protein